MFNCLHCSKSFESKKSLASHTNWHKKSYQEMQFTKNNKSGQEAAQKYFAEYSANKETQYNLNPKHCKNCNQMIVYKEREKTFCSRKCSGIFTAANSNYICSDTTKEQISSSLKNYYLINPNQKMKPKVCPICSIQYYKYRKTCSRECGLILLSEKIKLSIETGKHKGNGYRGRGKQSYMERSFEEWLISNNYTDYVPEKQVKIYKEGKYIKSFFIDFYFPHLNLGIELDGTHHNKENDTERDNLIMNCENISIYRISHKDYISKSKIDTIKNLLDIK